MTNLFDFLKGSDAKARESHPGAVPEGDPKELDRLRQEGVDIGQMVKPFDRYGRRRVFDVAHHTGATRRERRALKRGGASYVPPATNVPFERKVRV